MQTTKEREHTTTVVNDELRKMHAERDRLGREISGLYMTFAALGVIEMILGLLAISLPYYAGTFFTVLLGFTVAVSGILQVVGSITGRSAGRFLLGLISIAAGGLITAHPVFGLTFFTLALGMYLLVFGAAKLVVSSGSLWMTAGGVIALVLGVLILAGWPSTSAYTIGLLVGINLFVSGLSMLFISAGANP